MIEWKMTVLYSQLQFCTLWINEKASKNNIGSLWREKKKCTNCIQIRDDTHVTSMKIAQFSRPSSPLVQLRPKFFHALELDVQFQTPPSPPTPPLPPPPLSPHPHSPNDIKGNIILGWLLNVVRSFLQADFRFQFSTNSLILSGFLFTSFHLTEANLFPRAILKN